MSDRITYMENIFKPRTVAFVGASNSLAKWGGIIFMNMLMGGYQGKIYPVNPKEEKIQNRPAFKSVLDIPGEVDLAIFTIPAAGIPDAISECVKKGIKAGIVITAGFGELGEEGKVMQAEMVKRAREGGMVLVGPNGQGISCPSHNFHPWMPVFFPPAGSIGIASQSGNVATVLSQELTEYGFGSSKVVSAGNCADIGWPDYLEFFRRDPDTKVVLIYVEGVGDGRAFFEAAKKTSLEKPVVILKSGRTGAGKSAASSHTGVLAGSDDVFDAACRQAGLIRAATIEDAVYIAAAFVETPLPKGRRLGIITGGGGYGVIAADVAAAGGLDLVKFSPQTVAALQKNLPPWWSPNNPVDMVAGLNYGGPKELIPILMDSGEVDGIILLGIGWLYFMLDSIGSKFDYLDPNNPIMHARHKSELAFLRTLGDYATRWGKPLLMTSNSARLAVRRNYTGLVELLQKRIMIFPTIEDVVRAYKALAMRHEFLEKTAASKNNSTCCG